MIGKLVALSIGIPSWFGLCVVGPVATMAGGIMMVAEGKPMGIGLFLVGVFYLAFIWHDPRSLRDHFRTDVLGPPRYVINRENEARREAKRAPVAEPKPAKQSNGDLETKRAPVAEPKPAKQSNGDLSAGAMLVFCIGFGCMLMVMRHI